MNLISERELDDMVAWKLGVLYAGWSDDWEFIVRLESDSPVQLEDDDALRYAWIIAKRRRCKVLRSIGPVESGTGEMLYERTFRFARWE